jgi:hypothetical protein
MHVEVFRIAQFGARLGTRLEGERAREQLESLLGSLPDEGQVRVSLAGLEVLSTSFADELVGKAYQRAVDGEFGDRTMVLDTPSLELVEGIDVKLAQRRLAMLCLHDGRWRLVGFQTPALSETLERIIERKQTTARELAEDLGLQMSACVNRVARLADLRLIRRRKIGMKGPQDIFEIHSILRG